MKREEEEIKHESFGQIRFSRVNGRADFYGSELTQNHYISMEISQSYINRTLSKDWYHTDKNLVKVRMSASQFSELITSLNMGSGVPCTLERLPEKKIQSYPKNESRKEFVHRKFKDRMKTFATEIIETKEKAKELIKKKTLSKNDQQELNFAIERMVTEVISNIPFFAECFQENMDEVVQEAKLEVENAIQHKVTTLGLEKLHDNQKLLK